MYSEKERENLLKGVSHFMFQSGCFEGLLQIGSGATGFSDIYSDIDLMAGCFDSSVAQANIELQSYFEAQGAFYIDKRSWSETALGLSVYFENGLSLDISFMHTRDIPIRSSDWKILFSKTANFSDTVFKNHDVFLQNHQPHGTDDSIHHRFIYALRRVEIALHRSEFIYADMSLSEARQILLDIEALREGRKTHQFKAFNDLDLLFVEKLYSTYPHSMSKEAISQAKDMLLSLYLETIENCTFLNFDKKQLKLLGCFDS